MNSFESTKCQIFVGCTTNFNSQRLHFLHQNLYFLEMNSRLSSSTPFLLLQFSLLLFIIKFPPCWSFDLFNSCSKRFTCGKITNIGYPFWGDGRVEDCGHRDLRLICDKDKTTIKIKDVVYEVLDIYEDTQSLQIKRDDFFDSKGLCSPKYPSTTFDFQLFEYDPEFAEITISYDCPSAHKGMPGYFSCPDGSTHKDGLIQLGPETNRGCNSSLKVGIGRSYFGYIEEFWRMEEALFRAGFRVKYKVDAWFCNDCTKSGSGACGYDVDSNEPTCHCADGSSPKGPCPPQLKVPTGQDK
nr:LEAF RUST 10 DISEASE-RESISTANCE LOCUS RECEPTOR-LIKE PROTEIN KINASE-like 1.3 [Ziziphus jujuba var. spinosa]